MPKEIAPGVYILASVQTPEYANSKARKYVTTYTESRYENWQYALKAAEREYRSEMDAYKASITAGKNSVSLAEKELIDAQNDLDRLTKERRDTELSVAKYNAGQVNSSKRFGAAADNAATSQANSQRFSAENTKAKTENYRNSPNATSRKPDTVDPNQAQMVPNLAANEAIKAKGDYSKLSQKVEKETNVGGANASADDQAYLRREAVKKVLNSGITPKQMLANTPPALREQLEDDLAAAQGMSSSATGEVKAGTPAKPGLHGYDPQLVSAKDQLAAIDAEIEAKKQVIEQKRAAYTTARSSTNTLSAPVYDQVGRAKRIYSDNFEQLRNSKQRKAFQEELYQRVQAHQELTKNVYDVMDYYYADLQKQAIAKKTEEAKAAAASSKGKGKKKADEKEPVVTLTQEELNAIAGTARGMALAYVTGRNLTPPATKEEAAKVVADIPAPDTFGTKEEPLKAEPKETAQAPKPEPVPEVKLPETVSEGAQKFAASNWNKPDMRSRLMATTSAGKWLTKELAATDATEPLEVRLAKADLPDSDKTVALGLFYATKWPQIDTK